MPTGLRRFYGTHDLHFITCSCYRRQRLLGTPDRRDLFLEIFEQERQRYRFVVSGYVVMPAHFHLLITEREWGPPSTVMQAVKQRYTRTLQRLEKTSPGRHTVCTGVPVWQERPYDFNVWSRKKEIEKLRYIHRNPVERGFVACPEDWAWSSFRHYLSGEVGTVEIESQWTARKREKAGIFPTVKVRVLAENPRPSGA